MKLCLPSDIELIDETAHNTLNQISEKYYQEIDDSIRQIILEHPEGVLCMSDIAIIHREVRDDIKPKAIKRFELIIKIGEDILLSEMAYLFWRKDLE